MLLLKMEDCSIRNYINREVGFQEAEVSVPWSHRQSNPGLTECGETTGRRLENKGGYYIKREEHHKTSTHHMWRARFIRKQGKTEK